MKPLEPFHLFLFIVGSVLAFIGTFQPVDNQMIIRGLIIMLFNGVLLLWQQRLPK